MTAAAVCVVVMPSQMCLKQRLYLQYVQSLNRDPDLEDVKKTNDKDVSIQLTSVDDDATSVRPNQADFDLVNAVNMCIWICEVATAHQSTS